MEGRFRCKLVEGGGVAINWWRGGGGSDVNWWREGGSDTNCWWVGWVSGVNWC